MTGAVESTRCLDRSLKSPVLAKERGRSRRSDPDPPVDHLTVEHAARAVLTDRSHCLENATTACIRLVADSGVSSLCPFRSDSGIDKSDNHPLIFERMALIEMLM